MDAAHSVIEAVRASAVLTGAYVAGTILDAGLQYNQLVLYCYFTIGSLDSVDIKIESTIDGTNYVQETNMTVSGGNVTMNKGTINMAETGNFKIALPMTSAKVKVSVKGNGTVTDSLLAIDAIRAYV